MEEKILTLGEKAVGINFNPSNQDNVFEVNQLCAKLINIIEDHYKDKYLTLEHDTKNNTTVQKYNCSWLTNILRTAAINSLITAQMAVVKFLTWKE